MPKKIIQTFSILAWGGLHLITVSYLISHKGDSKKLTMYDQKHNDKKKKKKITRGLLHKSFEQTILIPVSQTFLVSI